MPSGKEFQLYPHVTAAESTKRSVRAPVLNGRPRLPDAELWAAMSSRGIRQNLSVLTSDLTGILLVGILKEILWFGLNSVGASGTNNLDEDLSFRLDDEGTTDIYIRKGRYEP